MSADLVLPEPTGHDPDGDYPFWKPTEDDETLRATPLGVDIDGYLETDVDMFERIALAMLAAIHAHRAMKADHDA